MSKTELPDVAWLVMLSLMLADRVLQGGKDRSVWCGLADCITLLLELCGGTMQQWLKGLVGLAR